MKKLTILASLLLAMVVSFAASATDLGVQYVHNGTSTNNSYGIVLNQNIGDGFGVEGSFDRSTTSSQNFNRWSVLGTKDLFNVSKFTVHVKAGGVLITTPTVARSYAVVAGGGVSYPLSENVKLSVDYSYESGQQSASAFDGNMVAASLKFAL